MNPLLAEKKEAFNDFRILWDEAIERKFAETMAEFPNANPETVLDNICLPYMEKAFKYPLETYAEWLRNKYGDRQVCKRHLVYETGTEFFEELLAEGYISHVKGNKYIIKEKRNG